MPNRDNKEFKYFVPQGVKTTPIMGNIKVGYTGTPNQFQNFNNSSSGQFLNSSNSNPIPNLNSSSHSGYRANHVAPGSHNAPVSKVLPSTVQSRPQYPPYQANGYQPQQSPIYQQPGTSQGLWRKQ